ncbi:MAG TPA: ATPase, T2SS/T4P/T4SS family [Kineosporiaceae bacterium]|nr:ATPase, T2SS/T4P/T4SS family [Kineosporiaceae bacterium]
MTEPRRPAEDTLLGPPDGASRRTVALTDLPLFHPPDGPGSVLSSGAPGVPVMSTLRTSAQPRPAVVPELVRDGDGGPQAGPAVAPSGRSPRARRAAPATDAQPFGHAGYDARAVDWGLVRTFRQRASHELAEQLRSRPGVDEEDRRELGRSIIRGLLEDHARADASADGRLMDPEDEQVLAAAIFDSLFGLGRLQPLVDLPGIENIEITGHDNVLLLFGDGRREAGPPVADSDEELVELLAFLAAQRGGGERSFSSAHPVLHLNLGGRARLAAIMEVSQRPVVRIRKHLLPKVSLRTMREIGTIDPVLETFLAAAVRARKSIVVSGAQGSGKTTFVRALADALDPWESIGTLETEYEIFLHEQSRPRKPIALEARPGSGELGPTGRRAGAITLDDLFEHLLRFNLDRVVVGEVRGGEVMAMFKAMQSGAGSLSTTHAKNARDTIERLITCVLSVHTSEAYAARLVAQHIDLIVHLVALDDRRPGRPRRVVAEVIEVDSGEGFRPAVTDLFRSDADGRPVAVGRPSFLDDLVRAGFDPVLLDSGYGPWTLNGPVVDPDQVEIHR